MTPLVYIGPLTPPRWTPHGWLWLDPDTNEVLAQRSGSKPIVPVGTADPALIGKHPNFFRRRGQFATRKA